MYGTLAGTLRDPTEGSQRAFCATCGHAEFVHSNSGHQRCLKSACDCNAFIVGAAPDLSAGLT